MAKRFRKDATGKAIYKDFKITPTAYEKLKEYASLNSLSTTRAAGKIIESFLVGTGEDIKPLESASKLREMRHASRLNQSEMAGKFNATRKRFEPFSGTHSWGQRRISLIESDLYALTMHEAAIAAIAFNEPIKAFLPDGCQSFEGKAVIFHDHESRTPVEFSCAQIKIARVQKGLTQHELVAVLDELGYVWSQARLSRTELGSYTPKLTQLAEISMALEQPMEFFIHPQYVRLAPTEQHHRLAGQVR
jgi:transcriptional regulator with XRE-family HTH domain